MSLLFTLNCPQLNAQVLVGLPESSMSPSATGTLHLPSSGPTYCSWTHPNPVWGHHPTFLRSLLLSCLKVVLLHQAPQTVQPTQPNPTPADPSLQSFPIPLYYLFFFIALLWSGINYIFLFCPPFPSPLHMHALECKSYEGRAPGLIHHLAPLTYKTV